MTPKIDLRNFSMSELERLQAQIDEQKEVQMAKPPKRRGDLSDERFRSLVEAHLAIEAQEAKEAGALGFMARALTMATMPHSKMAGNEFRRRNGAFSMSMLAPVSVGLPYGSKPRLLIAYMTTEAVRSKNRDIVLGRSLSEFMHELGLQSTGGRWGSITGLKQQMTRLFSSSVHCQWDNKDNITITNMPIVSKAQLWWDPKNPEQTGLWESSVKLGEDFFNEVISNPVPIDLRAVRAIKQSPLALDIYFWLTHRLSYFKKSHARVIPWAALQLQFGAGYPNTSQGTRDFRKQFGGHLRKVLTVYPQARVTEEPAGLVLQPSPSHIKKLR